jgi:hypothetical protein
MLQSFSQSRAALAASRRTSVCRASTGASGVVHFGEAFDGRDWVLRFLMSQHDIGTFVKKHDIWYI